MPCQFTNNLLDDFRKGAVKMIKYYDETDKIKITEEHLKGYFERNKEFL